MAVGGENLASAETIAEAGEVATTGSREAPVRGATARVTVAAVSWS